MLFLFCVPLFLLVKDSPSKIKQPSDEVNQFWLALLNNQIKVTKTDVFEILTLPSGIYWLGQKKLGSVLFIRACYKSLYKIIWETWNKQLWALLLGTPGKQRTKITIFTL